VRDSVGFACEVAQTSKIEALETMAKRVDLSAVEEGRCVCLQSTAVARKALLESFTEHNPSGRAPITHLRSKDGKTYPIRGGVLHQHDGILAALSAWVELPAAATRFWSLHMARKQA